MRELDLKLVTDAVEKMCIEANYYIGDELLEKIKQSYENETKEVAKSVLSQIIENDEIAKKDSVPMCQDTGTAVVFVEVGTEVKLNGDIYEAINEGVRRGYTNGYLRKSIVRHPLDRVNTKDNTPAIIHLKLVSNSDRIKIIIAPKGGGSENMSALKMMRPSDGVDGIKKFVLDTIKNAGGNPCPPIVVGIGIGGNFETVAYLSKKALMRDINDTSTDPIVAKLEKELLEEINELGVGPLGLGGKTTALAVKIETFPCHIVALPVAININCHAARHKEMII